MLFKLPLIISIALCQVGTSFARGSARFVKRQHNSLSSIGAIELTTNAARLANGFAPFKPRNLYSPTKTLARRVDPSSEPVVTYAIKIAAKDSGSVVGYFSRNWFSPGVFRVAVTTDFSQALRIVSVPGSPHLLGIYGAVGSNAYLGVTGEGVSPEFTHFVWSSYTDYGSVPVIASHSYPAFSSYVESNIWTYVPLTAQLTANWVNTNGVGAPAHLFYFPGSNSIVSTILTPGSWLASFPASYEVILTVV